MKDAQLRRVLEAALAISILGAAPACGGRVDDETERPADGTSGTRNVPVCTTATLPPDSQCSAHRQLPCSVAPDALVVDNETCEKACPKTDKQYLAYCSIARDSKNERYLACNYCASGRRPEGLEPVAVHGSPLGAFFASTSHLEAASVLAFDALSDELGALGAPVALRDRARRAARDEVRHARTTASLARRFGAEPGAWSAPPTAKQESARSLEAIATENAVEGCVRETFGALLGAWQAEHANEVVVQRTMRGIARDEARHAALAWSVAEWIEPLLDDEARARVDAARHEAVRELTQEVAREPDRATAAAAGLPSAEEARRLLGALGTVLWSVQSVAQPQA